MTIEIEGLAQMITGMEIAAWIGGVAFMLIAGLALYLLVRPPRRREEPTPIADDELDREDLRALVDRMERRLAVLERTIDDERPGRANGAEQAKRIN
ncbi:hypothetical protein [Sphingosinicella humi]|uniref:Envelope stress response membrane protein PspB n=1 Tax=Allosphingosinicella humi TaxID=2068657 RepID=A0A2U2IZV3_9SPHN|nr:hypothetical protein [Sphingosinicella humi]PWG01620.1 hypothetical protein DF286_01090 [Sphingosinicella humi]